MNGKLIVIFLFALLPVKQIVSQNSLFRSGIFLHHSTGGCIWNLSGATTNIPAEISKYNSAKGLTGLQAFTLKESGWPVNPWNNEWERWHRVFENKDLVDADIRPMLSSNKIVIIKSCFPSSDMSGYGTPPDTLNPTRKSIYNYKWHWRHIITAMKNYTQNFFVLWTNAPLVASSTGNNAAKLSHEFCLWAKDTLAKGLDKIVGAFPKNIFVFDFFHKTVGTDWKLLPSYAAGSSDSHPNKLATAAIAPQFVNEIFDAAVNYEKSLTSILDKVDKPESFTLEQNFPNPFNPETVISYQLASPSTSRSGLPVASYVTLKVYDILGREVVTLVDEFKQPGNYNSQFSILNLPDGKAGYQLTSGIYFYRLQVYTLGRAGNFSQTKKMVVAK